MGSNLPFIFALLTVAVVACHAALTPELYWNKVLSGASMPQAIRESLNPEFMEGNSTSIAGLKGGVTTEKSGKGTRGSIGKNDKQIFVNYYYATTATGLEDDPTLFFLEKDLVPGKTINLHFTKAVSPVSFLPRKVADSIPFSSRNFTNILNRFLIDPKSEEAYLMRKTIARCEQPGISGEQKYCATSLESMIDYTTKILGKKNVEAVSTESNEHAHIKKYKIEDSVNILIGDKEINASSVVCHKQEYVYAVFYCHFIESTKVFMVPLKSEDGTKVKAVAVCHKDTSKWNPKYFAFRVLKVKPGTVPICHFLLKDTVVWYRNQK